MKYKTKERLENVIQGINLIPSLSDKMQEDLLRTIDRERVEGIMVNRIPLEELSSDELSYLLSTVFEMTNDEHLSPDVLNKESDSKDTAVLHDESLYYRYEIKDEFSRRYQSEETRRVTMSLFRISADMEKSLDKDLCEFNVVELESFIEGLKATTIRSLQNYISKIERYTDFNIKNNYTNNMINYAQIFDKSERVESLLDQEAIENMVISREELMRMAIDADNAQDGVILALLFDGVSLKDNFEELINLKINSFDDEGKILVINNERSVPISPETAMLIRRSSEQDSIYFSISGERVRKYKIAVGGNIIRGLRGSAVVKPGIIGQRISRITSHNGYEYLNATNISYSGQIHMAIELMNKGDSIDEAISKVIERFSISDNLSSRFYLKHRISDQI